jgi:bifunctional non-homologous end joining protein LigD
VQRFAVFDCLYRNRQDLRSEPLSRCLAQNGLTAYSIAKRRGLEGVVAKDSDASYEACRSSKWLKVKVHQEEEFVIGGLTAAGGTRKHLGALLLRAYRGEDFIFVGKVRICFSQRTLADLAKSFRLLIRNSPHFVDPPREKYVTWPEPRLVAQIAFQEWTADQKLRQPVFPGLRDDKNQANLCGRENYKI